MRARDAAAHPSRTPSCDFKIVVSILLEFMGTGYNNPSSTEINYDIIILTYSYLRFYIFY